MPKALLTYVAPAIVGILSAPAIALGQDGPRVPTDPVGDPDPVNDLDIDGILALLTRVANILVAFVAVIAVIFIVIGGFKYVTSGGDEDKIGSARETITYGIVGLAVSLLAFAVITFVNDLVGGGGF